MTAVAYARPFATQQLGFGPPSRTLVGMNFHRVVKRVADRFGTDAALRWTRATLAYQNQIDEVALRAALVSGNLQAVQAAVQAGRLQQTTHSVLRTSIQQAAGGAGKASALLLGRSGMVFDFNVRHPNVVAFAQAHAADLVVGIPTQAREAIRAVVALGAEQGITVARQARAIREVIGLPPAWATAPLKLAAELKAGKVAAATARRLSAADRRAIRGAITRGPVTDAFVARMQGRYAQNLINVRALTIARTEALRAANFGVTESWAQAQAKGVLPAGARRVWLPTPDEKLSAAHALIPGMNPQGRRLDEPFDTPEGQFMHPPSRPRCRCGLGLMLPGTVAAPAEPVPVPPPPGPSTLLGPDADDAAVLRAPSSAYPPMRESDETINRFSDGTFFTPERQRLHDVIVRQHFRDVTAVANPEALVMGGGPASGKSEALKGLSLSNRVTVDPDHIKTLLPEFAEQVAVGNTKVSTLVHEESSFIAKRIVSEATRGRYNLLIDGTGDNAYENLAAKVAQYRAQGARVVARYVTVDTETAVARALARGQQTGRFVPETYLRAVHQSISQIVPRAVRSGLFDELTVLDTNGAMKEIVRVVGKRVTILDEPAWQRFLAKGQANPLANVTVELGGQQVSHVLGGPAIEANAYGNYLKAYGQEWKAAPLPTGIARGTPKECYANASKLVMGDPSLRYVEGVAYSTDLGPALPFAHAWAVTPEGIVIDATWSNPAGAKYFGVAYDRTKYLKYVRTKQFYGVLGGSSHSARTAVATGAKNLRWVEPAVRTRSAAPVPAVPRKPVPLSSAEAHTYLLERLRESSVTGDDGKDILRRYLSSGIFYRTVNGALRTGRGTNASRAGTAQMDGVFAAVKAVGRRLRVWRGGVLPFDATVGSVVEDLGFVSTSLSRIQADIFVKTRGKWLMRIDVSPQTRAIYMPAVFPKSQWALREREVLLNRGQRFRIVKLNAKEKIAHLELFLESGGNL